MPAKKTHPAKSSSKGTVKKSAKVVKAPSKLTPVKTNAGRAVPKMVKPAAKPAKAAKPAVVKSKGIKPQKVESKESKDVLKTSPSSSRSPMKKVSLMLDTKIQTAEGWRRDRLKEFKRI